MARQALFLNLQTTQHPGLVAALGCELDEMGFIQVDEQMQTTVAGLYAAGDMTSRIRAVIFASAQCAAAGIWINMALMAKA
ncbi:MAG: FAD-dependent oxidoreductase [Caldilineaceae bacterium]